MAPLEGVTEDEPDTLAHPLLERLTMALPDARALRLLVGEALGSGVELAQGEGLGEGEGEREEEGLAVARCVATEVAVDCNESVGQLVPLGAEEPLRESEGLPVPLPDPEVLREREGQRVAEAHPEALGVGLEHAVRSSEREVVALLVRAAEPLREEEGLPEPLEHPETLRVRDAQALAEGHPELLGDTLLQAEARSEAVLLEEALALPGAERVPPMAGLALARALKEGEEAADGEREGRGEEEAPALPVASLPEGCSEAVTETESVAEVVVDALWQTDALPVRPPVADVEVLRLEEGEAVGEGLTLPEREGSAPDGEPPFDLVALPLLEGQGDGDRELKALRESLGLALTEALLAPLREKEGEMELAREGVLPAVSEGNGVLLAVESSEGVGWAEGDATAVAVVEALVQRDTVAVLQTVAVGVGATLPLPVAVAHGQGELVAEAEGERETLAHSEAAEEAEAALLPLSGAVAVAVVVLEAVAEDVAVSEASEEPVVVAVLLPVAVAHPVGSGEGEREGAPLGVALGLPEGLRVREAQELAEAHPEALGEELPQGEARSEPVALGEAVAVLAGVELPLLRGVAEGVGHTVAVGVGGGVAVLLGEREELGEAVAGTVAGGETTAVAVVDCEKLLLPDCEPHPVPVRVVEGQWDCEGVAHDVVETDTEAGLDVASGVAVVQMLMLNVPELERLAVAQGEMVSVPLEVAEVEGQRETDGVTVDVAQLVTEAGFVVATGVAVMQVLGLGVLEPERLTEAQDEKEGVPLEVAEAEGQREGEGVTVGVAQLDTEAGFDVASADAVTQLLGEVVLEPERLTEAHEEADCVLLVVAETEGQ